ncbi:MAG: MoaD/ThiS family protein [Pirellulaceae bacterium]
MRIEVKLFAGARAAHGADTLQLELPAGATIADLRAAIANDHPQLAPLLTRALFALNTDYATDDTVIPAGAELACIPPVSGG